MLIQDIFLQSMSKYDFENIKGDTSVEFIIHPYKSDGEKITKHKNVNKNMSVQELKSLILFLTDYEPFCLKYFLKNSDTVEDFIK